MAATIKIKNSSTASAVPTSSDLVQGELAVNVTDKRIFTENASGTVVELGTNPSILTLPDGSASAPTLTNDGDTNTGIFFPAADTVGITTGGTERARVDSSGRFGIGSTFTPAAYQNINGYFQNGRSGWAYVVDDSANTHLVHNIIFNGTNNTFAGTGYASRMSIVDADGSFRWYQAGSGSAGGTASLSTRMTLDASGNLGVGVTSPNGKLSVAGNITLEPGGSGPVASSRPQLWRGADGFLGIQSGGDTGGVIAFHTSSSGTPSERARIDSSGNLLVGTTDTGAGTGAGFKFKPAGNGASAPLFNIVTANSTNSSSSVQIYSTGAGAYRFYVGDGGTIYATSTSISAISDERLKENIRDIDTGLDAVMALKPRRFDWKEGKGQNKNNAAGFIAQEFETVFPDSVGTSKAGEDGIEYKNINHEELIPTLVKALQELNAKFEAYKASHP
jgi:hypothetical protein